MRQDSNLFPRASDDYIVAPSGRRLRLVGERNTTPTSDSVPREVRVSEKIVRLQITTQRTGYTLQKIYGHPNSTGKWNKITLPQPAVVVPTYRAILTLYDSAKGEADSARRDLHVTRDASYYLGAGPQGTVRCRNIAFEPMIDNKNVYTTEEIHFPSAADVSIRGFFLLEDEAQRGKSPRHLHAKYVGNSNQYGPDIPFRTDGNIATNVMFHIGGFYEAALTSVHAKWLGGSEGCFAFIPVESVRGDEMLASQITLEKAFFSNRSWTELTDVIRHHRDSDLRPRFFVTVAPRTPFERDSLKKLIYVTPAIHNAQKFLADGADVFNWLP